MALQRPITGTEVMHGAHRAHHIPDSELLHDVSPTAARIFETRAAEMNAKMHKIVELAIVAAGQDDLSSSRASLIGRNAAKTAAEAALRMAFGIDPIEAKAPEHIDHEVREMNEMTRGE